MAWWFWILLWVALLALSALYIGFLGLRLFRSFVQTMRELEAAGEKLSPAAQSEGADAAAAERDFIPGVFRTRRSARVQYISGKLERRELRRQRRVERKRLRNQPQSLKDIPSL